MSKYKKSPASPEALLPTVRVSPKGAKLLRRASPWCYRTELVEAPEQLPAGAVFPFDFGFVPSTLADDGDPLDVLVLLETPTFPGCVVRARVIGVIDGQQTGRSGRTSANPRLIAVATKSTEYAAIRRLRQLPQTLIDEITHFFVSYNEATGKTYAPTGAFGPRKAATMIEAGIRRRQNATRAQKRRRPRPVRRVA